jgi:predicted RNA-binding protein associated with RNAse of E/G family
VVRHGDVEVDVVWLPDGRVEILDEEELEAKFRAGGITLRFLGTPERLRSALPTSFGWTVVARALTSPTERRGRTDSGWPATVPQATMR